MSIAFFSALADISSPVPERLQMEYGEENRSLIVMTITPRQKGRFHIAGLSQNIRDKCSADI